MLFNLFLTFLYVATPPPLLGMFTQALLPGAGLAAELLGRQRQGLWGLSHHPQYHLISLPVRNRAQLLLTRDCLPTLSMGPSIPRGRGCWLRTGQGEVRESCLMKVGQHGGDCSPKPGCLCSVLDAGSEHWETGLRAFPLTYLPVLSLPWPQHSPIPLSHPGSHPILPGHGQVRRAAALSPPGAVMKPWARVLRSRKPGGWPCLVSGPLGHLMPYTPSSMDLTSWLWDRV